MLKRRSVRAPPTADEARPGLGILAMVLGAICAALQAAFSKQLTGELPVALIVWWRFFGIFIIVLPFALLRHRRLLLIPPRPLLQILRGGLFVVASMSFVYATWKIPLADAISIAYVYPFAATALAALILRERVPKTGWFAVLVGFCGVLIVMRPSADGLNVYYLLALVAGLSFAVVLIVSRILAGPSPTFVTSTWTAGSSMLMMAIALPSTWITPDGAQLMVLGLISAFAAMSQILVIFACSRAPMNILAPFGYVEIPIATVLGIWMFSDTPDAIAWTGIVIIVTSGILVAVSQHRRGR